jgi:[glutamine synthetase] adenylyltransferase / [glutamine synthetase]-adenylyl-L-tyrosine phosphorylase
LERADFNTYLNTHCSGLAEFLAQVGRNEAETILLELWDTPNPRGNAGRLEDLLGGERPFSVREMLRTASTRRILFTAIGGSSFLCSILSRNPDLMERMILHEGYAVRKTRPLMIEELASRLAGLTTSEQVDRALRWYKEQEYLRIGIRDLSGLADVQEVMAELSNLAGASVEAATRFHWLGLVSRYGRPPVAGDRMGLVVFGMGKVSGHELNFSSDLDLIFFREPEEGFSSGPERVDVALFYEKLARAITRSLSEITEDGFVFRVDLRLRPEGEKGELVPSITNALDYYLGWGRTWERAALMKAVPIAGDVELAEFFLRELEPFIYRKHLDYSTLDDMRLMKAGIEAKIRSKPGVNIKLGQGGIREIEFFVQALQLINGGRTPSVRSASTLDALVRLLNAGFLDEKTMATLSDSYLFFRKTEHRIQINHQVQTHELPRTSEEQEELAMRMGYRRDALKQFLSDLERRRRSVEELFSSLLRHSGEEIMEQVSPMVRDIGRIIHDEKLTSGVLKKLGFDEPAAAYPVVRSLFLPREKKLSSEKARNLLQTLAPLFLEELIKVPEPGKALLALDAYVDALRSAPGYFSTFLENPATVRFLIKVLGDSRFFTELLIRHPQTLDSLIARGWYECPREKNLLQKDLMERLAYCEDLEAELDVLRVFKHEEMLSIGVHQLSGEIDSPTARRALTELAEVCLQAAVDLAKQEMIRKFGNFDFFDTLPLVIVGMGKLGGREMTYLSDLDVVFVYDPPSQVASRLSVTEIFTRLVHRIISTIATPTSEGTVYAIDTRLRPSGNQGPLVSTISSYRDYHRSVSQLWEKQALIRARPVVGPPALMQEVTKIVGDCIRRTGMSEEDLGEIARIRQRMESEIAQEDEVHVDLKTGRGGLVDVEFFVQANILKHSGKKPSILRHNTLDALSALSGERLISDKAFRTLDSGYRFLTNLEDRLRLMEHKSVDRIPLAGDKLRGLALRLGYRDEDGTRLLEDYNQTTSSVRNVFNSFFGVGR